MIVKIGGTVVASPKILDPIVGGAVLVTGKEDAEVELLHAACRVPFARSRVVCDVVAYGGKRSCFNGIHAAEAPALALCVVLDGTYLPRCVGAIAPGLWG